MSRVPRELALEANGLRFRALVLADDPDATPVLFLHATSFCADVWGPVWDEAAEAGARATAIAVDVRGHGGTALPPGGNALSWSLLADDALALASCVAAHASRPHEPVVLVGHSSGGTAALVAAARAPERVRGVLAIEPVLFDPPARPDADSFRRGRMRTRSPGAACSPSARVSAARPS
jgi:pimeloyl-ACP methyl ester carboxylesterase